MKRLQRRSRAAAIKACTPHDLRRSFVSAALEGGADIAMVQRLAGHASPVTTARYDRRPEHAAAQAARVVHVPVRRAGRVNESARNIPPPVRHRFPRSRSGVPAVVPPSVSHVPPLSFRSPIDRSGRWHRAVVAGRPWPEGGLLCVNTWAAASVMCALGSPLSESSPTAEFARCHRPRVTLQGSIFTRRGRAAGPRSGPARALPCPNGTWVYGGAT